MKEIETTKTTPEELLQIIDAQLAMQRALRGTGGRNRALLLAGGILFILIGAGVALLVLSQMLADLPRDGRRASAQTVSGNF